MSQVLQRHRIEDSCESPLLGNRLKSNLTLQLIPFLSFYLKPPRARTSRQYRLMRGHWGNNWKKSRRSRKLADKTREQIKFCELQEDDFCILMGLIKTSLGIKREE